MEFARESIFVSSLRSFCKVFFSVIGLSIALFFIMTIYSLFSSPFAPEEKTSLTLLPDLQGNQEMVALNAPVVLRINIDGVIGIPEKLTGETIETILLESHRNLLLNKRIKAILLHVDTPGGTVIDSDSIYRSLKEYKAEHKIPIYAYIDGMCASGGMYVTSAADKTYASPASTIGSVGVIYGPLFNFSEVMKKVGVESKTLSVGIDKDELNPFRPWKADEGAPLKKIISFLYDRFVDVVTEARPRINRDKLISEYGANVFDGPTAQNIGYIDVADANYKMALAALLEEAKIDPAKPYQVVELQPKVDLIQALAQSSLLTGKLEHVWNLGETRSSELRDQFSYLFDPTVALK